MIHAPESFLQFGKSSIETALTVADITLRSTERLVDLQMKTAKEALEQGMRNVRAFSGVRNVQELVALQSKTTQPSFEHALAYSRDVYAVATDAQARISNVLKTRMSSLGGEFMTVIDQAAKDAPAGPDSAFAAIRSAFAPVNNGPSARLANHAGKVAPANRTGGKHKAAKKKAR